MPNDVLTPAAFWGAIALLVLGLVLGGALTLRARRWNESRVSRARTKRGLRGERVAERLLAKRGYKVIARQVAGSYQVDVDGEAREVSLNADLLVARHGRSLIAEVKTGAQRPRFEHPDTRRQLLEYQLAFGGDGILLVDPEREEVREVRFPFTRQVARPGLRAGTFLVIASAALFTLWWWRHA
jgi:Holliday junction resolvase